MLVRFLLYSSASHADHAVRLPADPPPQTSASHRQQLPSRPALTLLECYRFGRHLAAASAYEFAAGIEGREAGDVVLVVAELADDLAGAHACHGHVAVAAAGQNSAVSACAHELDVVDPVGVRSSSCCRAPAAELRRGGVSKLLPLYDSRIACSGVQR